MTVLYPQVRIGRWTLLEKTGATTAAGSNLWHVRCICGYEGVRKASVLTNKKSLSCGCYRTEMRTIHGAYGTKTHKVWSNMIQRCTNPKNPQFHDYGGRGIVVCDRWRMYGNFVSDMGASEPFMTIERIDNNMGYMPSNCRWATRAGNLSNTRRNKHVTFNGKTQTVTQWALELGINSRTLFARLEYGWPVERALTETLAARRKSAVTLSDPLAG